MSEETRKIDLKAEQTEQTAKADELSEKAKLPKAAELSEQDLDKVAGGTFEAACKGTHFPRLNSTSN